MASEIEPKRRVSSVRNPRPDDTSMLAILIARPDDAVPRGDSRAASKKQRF